LRAVVAAVLRLLNTGAIDAYVVTYNVGDPKRWRLVAFFLSWTLQV
jgi:hypothetical protein